MRDIQVKKYKIKRLWTLCDQGVFAVPEIQREFVWDYKRASNLLDGVYRQLPIGSLLVWETGPHYRHLLRQAQEILPPHDDANRRTWFLIDGQQRLAVLYRAKEGHTVKNYRGRELDFSKLCFSFDRRYESRFLFVRRPIPKLHIPLKNILAHNWRAKLRSLPQGKFSEVEKCRSLVAQYEVPVMFVLTSDLEEVREAFLRINSGGLRISKADRAFTRAARLNLRRLMTELRAKLPHGFNEIDPGILQSAMALIAGQKELKSSVVESVVVRMEEEGIENGKVSRKFTQKWRGISDCIKKATDHLTNEFGVTNLTFLPSDNMVATLALFFHANNRAQPNAAQENLRKICSVEALSRIDVVNLDAWVANFLRTQGYRHQVVFDEDENEAWAFALNQAPTDLGLAPNFYRSEWEQVIQAQNITDADGYLRASRIGRGTRLTREAKKRIWPVFQEYRAQLNEQGKKEYIDLLRDARGLIQGKGISLPYRAIIVDEAQDMSAEAFRLLRAIVPEGLNDLFIVGDAHQRIYRHRTSLRGCGINIKGRGRKLKINYRTTDEIRRFAVRLLEGREIDDLDGGVDEQKGYVSLTHGSPPLVRAFASFADETAFLKQHIAELQTEGAALESVCLVARTKRLLEGYISQLQAAGFAIYEIRRSAAEQRDKPGLRLATMHRVKGLEFEHVVAVAANKGIIPLEAAVDEAEDAVAMRNAETGERSLLYVALTRARRSATITGYGPISPFLPGM